ncbi:SAM-dependent methyltransferase [Spirillospora sp. NPDC029432]|uniref:SAM-dependent methyltransferase n=1 Tax=Spirillospora sp. NPDC029432 TaxID=3154599 RepID=UPI003456EFC9
MTDSKVPSPAGIPDDVPTSARAYGWLLGGKDNYEVDRRFIKAQLEHFPAGLDITRQNRLFLYRAVRHLTLEAGIRQFIDMGCGLPTDNNVHQVAQGLVPDARVVYVDIDPVVLAHGRALLADNATTTVINADMRDQEEILEHEDVRRLIDFDEPVGVLFLSVGHHLPDEFEPRRVLTTILDRSAPGSHLTFSQVVCEDPEEGALMTERVTAAGIPWQTRTPAEVDRLFDGLEPVEPGLVNLAEWRPMDLQPPLPPVPAEIAQYEGASKTNPKVYEYGGVLRKP